MLFRYHTLNCLVQMGIGSLQASLFQRLQQTTASGETRDPNPDSNPSPFQYNNYDAVFLLLADLFHPVHGHAERDDWLYASPVAAVFHQSQAVVQTGLRTRHPATVEAGRTREVGTGCCLLMSGNCLGLR